MICWLQYMRMVGKRGGGGGGKGRGWMKGHAPMSARKKKIHETKKKSLYGARENKVEKKRR